VKVHKRHALLLLLFTSFFRKAIGDIFATQQHQHVACHFVCVPVFIWDFLFFKLFFCVLTVLLAQVCSKQSMSYCCLLLLLGYVNDAALASSVKYAANLVKYSFASVGQQQQKQCITRSTAATTTAAPSIIAVYFSCNIRT